MYTANIFSPTIHAFWTMYENNVSAVAVVDDEGLLVGNLSASDIKVSLSVLCLKQIF
jgi:CBS domain-containing protein